MEPCYVLMEKATADMSKNNRNKRRRLGVPGLNGEGKTEIQLKGAQNMATHKGTEHHKKAAEHHELAAKHHREAAKLHEAGSHEKAAHHAQIAAGHGLHAVYHTEEATKHHADEHTGKGTAA
jgi:hypothetical protein